MVGWRALLPLSLLGTTWGLIENLVTDNDPRQSFHIESFGFESGGHISIDLKNFELMVRHDYVMPKDDKFRVAFVLQHSESDLPAKTDRAGADFCFHENSMHVGDDILLISSRSNWEHFEWQKDIKETGYYHLYFSNCEKGTHTGFELGTVMYNVDAMGTKVYLSAGEKNLPSWYGFLCFAFVLQMMVWARVTCKASQYFRSIHSLMTSVLVFKILTLFCEIFKYTSLKTLGHNNAWNFFFHVFSFLKGTLMFSVIILIGTGWSYLKPFLTDRDKQIILVVLVVQLVVNVASAVLDGMAPGSLGWMSWTDFLRLLDVICCVAILLPIVWSIRHLNESAEHDGKAARNASRLKNFRTFYLSVVSYVYFTRIIVYLLEASVPFEMVWVGTVFNEAAAFMFYGVTGYLFRPQSLNPYMSLSTDVDDEFDQQLADL